MSYANKKIVHVNVRFTTHNIKTSWSAYKAKTLYYEQSIMHDQLFSSKEIYPLVTDCQLCVNFVQSLLIFIELYIP